MTELTGGVIPGMFQKQYDIKRGYPILQVRFLWFVARNVVRQGFVPYYYGTTPSRRGAEASPDGGAGFIAVIAILVW